MSGSVTPARRTREESDSEDEGDFEVSVDGESSARSNRSKRARLDERDSNDEEDEGEDEEGEEEEEENGQDVRKTALPERRSQNIDHHLRPLCYQTASDAHRKAKHVQ